MQQVLDYIRNGIAVLALVIIIYGVVLSAMEWIREEWRRFRTGEPRTYAFKNIRYEIGFHLILGLEFLIAADIINTILRPTLEELAILAGTIAIRTALSFFLNWEIKRQIDHE